jgi:hypothetical protein
VKTIHAIVLMILLTALFLGPMSAQHRSKLGDNAALRYYAAFSAMRDFAVTDDQAKELNGILDGPIPYVDSKYKDLVDKNRPALELMARGTALANCDWGLDYQLGEDTPAEYARNALALGRLNVLYAFHLQIAHDNDAEVRTLAAGIRFSHDVANGGSLFATLAAKDLLTTHFRAVAFSLHAGGLSPAQRLVLQKAVEQLGPTGLDWQSATTLDLESLRGHFAKDPKASATLTQIIPTYIGTLIDPSKLPALQKLLAGAPQQVSEVIPNPKRILEEKQDFTEKLLQTRSLLH